MKKKISLGLILLAAFFVWNNFILALLPGNSGLRRFCIHAPVGIIFFLSIIAFFQTSRIDKLSKEVGLILFFLTGLAYFYRSDMFRVLEYLSFYGGILGFLFLAKKAPISVRDIFNGIFYIGVPLSLIGSALRPTFGLRIPYLTDYSYFLIQSTHYTGVLFSIFSLVSIIRHFDTKKAGYLVTFFLGITVVLFSLGRTELVAIVISSVAYFVLFKKFSFFQKKKISIFILTVGMIISAFIIPQILSEYKIEGFWGKRLKMSYEHYDVTAGRSWLWRYHMNLFEESFWTGSSRDQVSFVIGDNIDGGRAKAGSESFFTKTLARDGVFGFITLYFFLRILWLPIKQNNLTAFTIILLGLIFTVGLSTLGSTYSTFGFIIYWAYFSALLNPGSERCPKKSKTKAKGKIRTNHEYQRHILPT